MNNFFWLIIGIFVFSRETLRVVFVAAYSANGQWFIVSYDSANKQKHHKSHRMPE